MRFTQLRLAPVLATLLVADLAACGAPVTQELALNDATFASSAALTTDATATVVYERVLRRNGDVLFDESTYLSDDAESLVRAAVGLQRIEGRRAFVENTIRGSDDSDDAVGDLVTEARVLVADQVLLSPDERVALLDHLEAAGAMASDAVTSRKSALADRVEASPRPVLSDHALAELASAAGPIAVELCTEDPPAAMLPARALVNEILYGFDRETARASLEPARAARDGAIRESQARLRALLPSDVEASVLSSRPCLGATLTPKMVSELAANRLVAVVYVGNEVDGEAHTLEDGKVRREATQTEIYRTNGRIGDITPSKSNGFPRLTVGVIDVGFNEEHRAFRDTSATSPTRVLSQYLCGSTSCIGTSNMSSRGLGPHGTAVAGVLAGDLDDGQDSTYPSSTERQKRSGGAGESGMIFFDAAGESPNRRAIDRADFLDLDMTTTSVGVQNQVCPGRPEQFYTNDGKCRGESTALKASVRAAYDDGIFMVYAAGNSSAADSQCTCTVNAPGDAEGLFLAAATQGSCVTNDQATLRAAPIRDGSSEGGGELGGVTGATRERTLIGLAAPDDHSFSAICTANDAGTATCDTASLSQYNCSGAGTSFAAPTIAAAAINLKHLWISQWIPTTFLDDAGNMHATMLLMGDRSDNNGTSKRATGFSTRFGGGRLKARYFGNAGMDSPWLFRNGVVDIDDGELYQRWIGPLGQALPLNSDTDRIVMVIWWFEPETVSASSDISLAIEKYNSTCTTLQSVIYDPSFDTRRRVSLGVAGGGCYRFRIEGFNVTKSPPVTGLATRTVHWAYYYEDTDRDDADGPLLHSPVLPDDVELP